jgi:Domain of Unknown Function (DUF1080)
MMKRLLFAVALVATLAACNNSSTADTNSNDSAMKSTAVDTSSSAPVNDSGWVSLFDGTSLNGWHSYGQKTPGAAWKTGDGSIYLDTASKSGYQVKGGGDLITDDEFDNFDLKLQWKISEGGNSGIIFYINEDTTKYKESWNTGLEMQVLDNERHSDAKIKKHRAGDLYDLIACSKETVKPANEWNDVEIISNNGKLDLMLNGTNVISTTLWDDAWKKMVAGSKFKTMAGFGTFRKGHIGLQDHGHLVWYRNIKIKKL